MKEERQQNAAEQGTKENRKSQKATGWRRVRNAVLILLCLGILGYASLVGLVCYWEANVPVPSDYDSIIILGAQVLPTGQPSVQLRWRLDKGMEMYQKNPCPVVVCGAQGGNEPAPEGQIMRELLIQDGMPENQVFAETASEDTQDNIKNAWDILSPMGCEKPLIVTSDYHLTRALWIAQDVGLHPQGAGSLCKNEFSFWAKNHLREALAWVKYWGIKYLGLPL